MVLNLFFIHKITKEVSPCCFQKLHCIFLLMLSLRSSERRNAGIDFLIDDGADVISKPVKYS